MTIVPNDREPVPIIGVLKAAEARLLEIQRLARVVCDTENKHLQRDALDALLDAILD